MIGDQGPRRTACAGVDRFVIACMGRRKRRSDFLPRTSTRIDESGGTQLFKRSLVDPVSLALHVGFMRPADIRAFTPMKPQPAQILQRPRAKLRLAAWLIEV